MIKGSAKDYMDKPIIYWNNDMLNSYVITSDIANKENTLINRIGRIIQIRITDGSFFVRCVDNSINDHTIQSFYTIYEHQHKYLDELFKNIPLDDPHNNYYSRYKRVDPQKGFIISYFKIGDVVEPILLDRNEKSKKLEVIGVSQDNNYKLKILGSDEDEPSNLRHYNLDNLILDNAYYRKQKLNKLMQCSK